MRTEVLRRGAVLLALGGLVVPPASAQEASKGLLERPYTTMAAADKAVASGAKDATDLVFAAALCADWKGDAVRSRDYLTYFLDQTKGDTPSVRRALVRLCLAGGSPECFRRYLECAPHDLDALYLGVRQMERQVVEGRSQDFTAQLRLLIGTWPKGGEFDAILRSLYWAVHQANVHGISDCRGTLRALAATTGWSITPRMDVFLDHCCRRGADADDLLALYLSRPDEVWPRAMLERLAKDPSTAATFAKKRVQPSAATLAASKRRWLANMAVQGWGNRFRSGAFKGKPAEALKAAGEALGGFEPWEFEDLRSLRFLCENVTRLVRENPKAAVDYPFEPLARFVFESPMHDAEISYYSMLLQGYAAAGRLKEGFARIGAAAEKAGTASGAASRRLALACHADVGNGRQTFMGDAAYDRKGKKLRLAEFDRLDWVAKALRTYAKSPVPELIVVPDLVGVNWDAYCRAPADEKAYRTKAETVLRLAARHFYPNGAPRLSYPGGVQIPVDQLLAQEVARDAKSPAAVGLVASVVRTGRGDARTLVSIARTLLQVERPELAYLLLSRHRDLPANAEMQKLVSEISDRMPGLYPVDENDPAYPLYVAADELSRNNPERAWALLSANLKAFDRDPMRFRPRFAIWALDQFRKVRGEGNALRDKAWNHVERLLEREASLPSDTAAELHLLRARIAEDRLQYDVAHAGYQALRNHPVYRKTKAGRQAMFADIELMLLMGSVDSAEQTAEAWIAAPEEDVRAQGHYVLARIAFLRKDYPGTREELAKVFEIDFTHAAARLLQGEWKLATNYEVDDPQVLLGDLSDRSVIRPGQPLTVSVQDRNLAVAGGAASIPVIVTTSAGRDEERILLCRGTRETSVFRGSIMTVPGLATTGNGRLELLGDDRVSYRIDPAFQRDRGIDADVTKTLTVADDAELTVGSGDERRPLKPGLPLRLRLVDRDRSRSAGATSVEVEIATSSGDRLPAAVLKETGAGTGVFEAEVATSIPPPRAFADDSTSGMGPQDLVSSVRNGSWQSRQDGAKPKSVGVDTMSSHLVSRASVLMPSPENVAQLRLYGSLYGEEVLLGAYPAEGAGGLAGIRVLSAGSWARNRTDFVRELSRVAVRPEPCRTWGVVRTRDGHAGMRHLVRGSVYIAQDTVLRLRLRPTEAKSRDALRWLTCEFRIDGTRVFGGFHENDQRAKSRSAQVAFEAGIHDFEIYAGTMRTTDSFELCQERDNGELVPLPVEWTDEKVHPELVTRRTPKCNIIRTKTGYVAGFTRPERLRTLRWEFLDYAGMSVTVSKLRVTDDRDRQVIPSESDYTSALGNDTLEVAPGDRICVTYKDAVNLSGQTRLVQKTIGSSFSNGRISFRHEVLEADRNGLSRSRFVDAFRVAPGDVVTVEVFDPDLDLTPDADEVTVTVESPSGGKLSVKAREPVAEDADGLSSVPPGASGVFRALVRTVKTGAAKPLPPETIALGEGEGLTAAYADEDNTSPGVPVVRTARLAAAGDESCRLELADTWSERLEDKSPEGATRLETIRRRPGGVSARHVWRTAYHGAYPAKDRPAVVTPEVGLPVRLTCGGLVRHAESTVDVKIATAREIEAAKSAGRDPAWARRTLRLAPRRSPIAMARDRSEIRSASALPNRLYGMIDLYSSAAEERAAQADDGDSPPEEASAPFDLRPGEELVVRCENKAGKVLAETRARLGTTAWMALVDGTATAAKDEVHLDEAFHIAVVDPDRDVSDEQDEVSVVVTGRGGTKKTVSLRETQARSGVFTGSLVPVRASPGEAERPSAIASGYGDELAFVYRDDVTGVNGRPGDRTVTGRVLPGSDGEIRAYSKRFRDADQAVLVQFRQAECLFEMAKDFRKLKDAAKSAAAIAEGRQTLEAALHDYPNSSHAAEGSFLLANLYEQLAEEERLARQRRIREGGDPAAEPDKSSPLYREAVSRFSEILSSWPEGEYAARSQYHKALCLERLGDFAAAAEEYVKMTYMFPDSPLVGDASVRLASHYYANEKRYDVAAKIYTSFRRRFPSHPQAPNALFMGGQCLVKQAESLMEREDFRGRSALIGEAYRDAVESFRTVVEEFKDIPNKELLAQALYWAGDISFRLKDYSNAYIYLKRTTFEYPESKWARHARGMLLQEAMSFEGVAQ